MGGSTLNFLPNGPFRTGNEPSAIIIDPRGKFIYVTNSLDSTVSPYEIDLATGVPTGYGERPPARNNDDGHPAGRPHGRSGAGPVCLYRQLPGQLRLRLQPGPDLRRADRQPRPRRTPPASIPQRWSAFLMATIQRKRLPRNSSHSSLPKSPATGWAFCCAKLLSR